MKMYILGIKTLLCKKEEKWLIIIHWQS